MKKILSLLLVAVLSFSLAFALSSCGGGNGDDEVTQIRIGCLTGPTGMGMAKLISDNGGLDGNDKYQFNLYTDTNTAKKDLLAGRIDLICYPTNDAANIYNNEDVNTDVTVIAINTLSSLFLLTDDSIDINSFEELSGKTVYTCKNGTPRMILQYLVDLYDLDITVSYTVDGKEMLTPDMLKAQIIAGKVDIAVAPEPIVTAARLNNSAYSVDLDLSDAWNKKIPTELAMGCVIGNADFIKENKAEINAFLTEYKSSVAFMTNEENIDTAAEYCKEIGIMGNVNMAKVALKNLKNAICCIEGDEMKEILVGFYQALNISLPGEDFYYEK